MPTDTDRTRVMITDTVTGTNMATIMSTESSPALYRLLTWLSPAYPVGAFAYSQGLETAIARGIVTDLATTRDWIEDRPDLRQSLERRCLFARARKRRGTR